jgi:hypothetical protein
MIGSGARVTVRQALNLSAGLNRALKLSLLGRIAASGRLNAFANREPLFRYVFPWALERAKQRYAGEQMDEALSADESHQVAGMA